ncbi:TPA: hypothetical protein IU311_003064 [Enterococcus faecalis]|uniref:hypothetical protein n=1 Tax=Enterococcus TaxID=1350 RepID=UPI00033045DE|nr:hypothetical protein [Enterococcus faecalis]EGO5261432.1 hypothetical protein [Enterococcus faecalis]EGO8141389.1 hypothetical protein [Enterococcus faecalis]EGO8202804.1 hypothetical protein [Enterococcus faecalis]EHM3137983.1 hypothetical protein [Enterococcus faecalis]EIV0114911.1 hypothetical protein [Enterococcus faecalis]
MEDKTNWLEIKLTFFKSTGKFYSEESVLIPNKLSLYDRRKFLEEYIESIDGNEVFTYVSLDSSVIGYPYMRCAKKDWYED